MPKIKKIVLIETKSPCLNVFSSAKLPRMGVVIIATILKQKGYDIKAYVEDIAQINYSEIKDADLVGISSITSTSTRSYKIISEIKKINPTVPIVMGGPHPTFIPDEAIENGSDFVVRGEGEKTIIELLNAIEGNGDFSSIDGLSYKSNNEIIHNKERKLEENLDNIPFPDWTLLENYKKINYIPIQTSRGCPYGCKFCSVIKMFGRKYRFKSVDNTLDEIKHLLETFSDTGAKRLFFYDDNLGANRKRIKELLNRIIDEKINMPTWFSQERLDLSEDEELIALMAKTGCKRVMVGVESVNPKTLEEYKKNQSVEDIKSSIKIFHKHGIGIHGMFVLGGENDDSDTVKKTMNFIIDNEIDTVQVLILTPFPGTEVYDEIKSQGRLILEGEKNWSLYDGHHVVFQPNLISPLELQAKVSIGVLSNIYSYWRALKLMFKDRKLINALIVIKSNMVQKEWIKTNKEYLEFIENMQKGPFSLSENN